MRASGKRFGPRRAAAILCLGLALAVAAGGTVYAVYVEPRRAVVVSTSLTIPCLPRELSGLRLVQLSDLHLGSNVDRELVRAGFAQALTLEPDLIVLTGDYVSSLANGEAAALEAELARLAAPLGVYAVLGNHDHWADENVVAEAIRRSGVTLLRNEAVALRRGEGVLYLAGVDDYWERRADLGRALADVPPAGCVVLLAHEPDYADEVARDGRVALQLSGHSHGGQVRLPGLPPVLPRHAKRYPEGLRQVGSLSVYTNRGLGLAGLPVRFNCPPEITLLELRAP